MTFRGSTSLTPGSRKSHSSSRQKPHTSPTSLAGRYSRDLYTKSKEAPKSGLVTKSYISLSDSDDVGDAIHGFGNSGTQHISLDDDDDDVVPTTSKSIVRVEDDPDMSDEEFPELAREAKQREEQKALERLKAARSFENQNHDSKGSNTPDYTVDDVFQERPASEDPMIEIFISSVIEGSNPLIVRRKLSQKVKEVRLIWCDKQFIDGQPFPKALKASIFLTWRGKRLFDVTSCKSLGLMIDETGQLYSDGEGVMDGKVHFQAWTQDLFDSNQRRLAAQNRDNSEEEPEVTEPTVEKIKLCMKAKGMEPVKLQVKGSTTFQKMASAFRESRGIPEGSDIELYFDGEKLDPESKMEDTEIEDRDIVDVHIR